MTPQVAIIGCGYWGNNLVRNFAQLGALRMVGDTAEAGRKLAAEIAPYAQVVANVEEMLGALVEGAVIATPAETHYELTRQALEAGKDVLCEKPLALTFEQGTELVCLAARQGCILMLRHVLECHPGLGVPARQAGWMSRHGHRLDDPDGDGVMICPESGWRYKEMELGVLRCQVCLPLSVAVPLGLELAFTSQFELADGTLVQDELVFVGKALSHGEYRDVEIVLTRSEEALLGTGLLEGESVATLFEKVRAYQECMV